MESKENINFIFQLNNKALSGNFFLLYMLANISLFELTIAFVMPNKYELLITTSGVSIAHIFLFTKVEVTPIAYAPHEMLQMKTST
ncbi:MAG: hypothetical protein ACERKD_01335 [Prolixibacteraceae bacterium]